MKYKPNSTPCDCYEPDCLKCSQQKADADNEADIAHAFHVQDVQAQALEDLKSDGFVDNDDGDEEDPLGTESI